MKTRISIAVCFILLALAVCANAATEVVKISAFPNTNKLTGTDLFLLAIPGVTNKNISYNQMRESLGTNGANIQIITNLTVLNEFHGKSTFTSNLYVTNIFLITATTNYYLFNTNIYNNNTFVSNYFFTNVINNAPVSNAFFTNFFITNNYATNLTVTNYFQGNTFISNYFNTNVFTQSFVSNYYVTNLFTTTTNVNITTNVITQNTITNVQFLTVSNAYITNLFVTSFATNYFVFNTNITQSPTFISNYFVTNINNNAYVSNFFVTNTFVTNVPTTFITITNFYAPDTFVSNFFNTNVFFVDNSVSNYFVTNLFPTTTLISNTTINVSAPLTNATLYGVTSFSPISGPVPGRISLLSGGVETISLAGSNSAVTANTMFFKTNAWGGPSNTLDMNVSDQGYASFTACSITGLINKSNSVVQSVVLTLTNKSSTNWLLTLSAGLVIPERTNQVTVSNASQGMISIRYHPTFGSNGVYRQF